MRKLFKLAILMAFICLSNTAFAQKDWQWADHGVGFSAPANLRVTTNNASEFSAEGSDLFITIHVEQNGEVNEDNLAEALVAAAEAMEYDNITAVDALEIHDFTGYFVEGTKEGVGALIITLLDKKSSTNLVIVMVYTSDAAHAKAIDIGNSFYAFD